MFIIRTISGAVLLVIMAAAIIAGEDIWLFVTAALSYAGMFEMFRALNMQKSPLAFLAYICNLLVYGLPLLGLSEYTGMAVILYFVLIMSVYVIKWDTYNVTDISKALFVFVYTGTCMSYLYRIRMLNEGLIYIWLVFIGAWGSDTCAYLTGMLIGKHRLPSTLSPKKTVEGCVGGIAGASLIGALYGMWANTYLGWNVYYVFVFAACGAVGSALSQTGDLCASAVKRNCGIKDYGKLIPGHGGIMDRFDSIIFLGPIIFYILVIFEDAGVEHLLTGIS